MTGAAATYILIALWPLPGGVVDERREAATTRQDCEIAAHAALADVGRPLYAAGPAAYARCEPGNLFAEGWSCIRNYNCPSS